jgi:tellurite methyltransferase
MTSRGTPDRSKWEELYATGARPDKPPSAWIVAAVAALPNEGPIADVAGGTGRHAIPVARGGRRVILVDFVAQAVASARIAEPSLAGVVADAAKLPLRQGSFGVVMVANFLDRTIFPDLQALLVPGGFLVYETYTTAHQDLVQRGLARGPQTSEFLLRPGELPALAQPLTVIDYWEGEVDDDAGRRCCARLIAERPEAKARVKN